MKYALKSFTVGGTSQSYRDGWERTFRSEPQVSRCIYCDAPKTSVKGQRSTCPSRASGHEFTKEKR